MAKLLLIFGTCSLTILLLIFVFNRDTETLKFAGGPDGGTFILFASGIVDMLKAENPDFNIEVTDSGGSIANLKKVEAGKAALALAYSGDAYLGRLGELNRKTPPLTNIRALGRIYGSTAQLAVRQESVIQTPYDLAFRRVAIGSSGSGSATSAERYFSSLGIWDQITPLYLGYRLGIKEVSSGRAEAVWQLVGAPSASIEELNSKHQLRFIDLGTAARGSDFFVKHPYYTEARIPPGTYLGQPLEVETFQDNSLLVAHLNTDAALVRASLELLYSPKGIAQLRKVHPIAKDLDIHKGLQGVRIPLHPAAEEFWKELGQR